MTAEATLDRAAFERIPRRTLLWGGGLLVAGLAAVGVGAADEGAALALGGLLLTIFGIHRFGRLGPDEPEIPPRLALDRAAAASAMWEGGLLLVAALSVTAGGYFFGKAPTGNVVLAYAALLAGGARLFSGWAASSKARATPAKSPPATEPRPPAKRRRPQSRWGTPKGSPKPPRKAED